jgi:hypothetical protein
VKLEREKAAALRADPLLGLDVPGGAVRYQDADWVTVISLSVRSGLGLRRARAPG